MRTGMFPQRVGIISGATETTEKRTKMSSESPKAIGTKATRWEMRTSLTRRNTPSMLSRPADTDTTEMKTRMIQLSAGTTSPAMGARAKKTRRRRRRKLCPVSITIITSSGMSTEATEKRKMKTRERRMSPLSMDTRSTDTRTMGRRRMKTSQRNMTMTMAPATDTGATKKMMMTAMMLSPPSADIKSTGTKIMGRRRRRRLSQRNIPTITAPATDTRATKKKMMMKKMTMILSPLSTDIKSTGTEITGRRRMKLSQRNITTITVVTRKTRVRMCPLNTGTRLPDIPTMALETRRRRRRRSQSSSATLLQATNPKATRALRGRTSQIIKKQPLAMTIMESPKRKMRTFLPGLATRLPATGSKTTEMRGLATEGPSRKRLATGPQNTWG